MCGLGLSARHGHPLSATTSSPVGQCLIAVDFLHCLPRAMTLIGERCSKQPGFSLFYPHNLSADGLYFWHGRYSVLLHSARAALTCSRKMGSRFIWSLTFRIE